MSKVVEQWTDARLDGLSAAVAPLPAEVAVLRAAVHNLSELGATLAPLVAQVAVLSASVQNLVDENRVLREELAASQRQLIQIGWGLVAALVGAAAALVVALM